MAAIGKRFRSKALKWLLSAPFPVDPTLLSSAGPPQGPRLGRGRRERRASDRPAWSFAARDTIAFVPPAPPESEAERTFELAMSRAELASDAAPDATLQRRVQSLPPEHARLPVLNIGRGSSADFEEGECLGQGGMGVVHAALDPVLGRGVAVKRPKRDAGPKAASALLAEARTLAALDHPNVAPVHTLGRDGDDQPVLVMKRVIGKRWSDVVSGGPNLDRDLQIVLQVADALRFAHARGRLHRDVKPDNVMVGEFGEVYLMDWGCACHFEAGTTTTELVGTPTFMAPEMLAVGREIGAQTDVFLLGATLHRVLVGAPRNAGKTMREVLQAARVAAPASFPEHVPVDLGLVINRACAADSSARHATVEAFAAEIRDFLRHRVAAGIAQRACEVAERMASAVRAGNASADALFAECQLGFSSALEAWPGCIAARDGFQQACNVFIPAKITAGELGIVEAILPRLDSELRGRWTAELATARSRRAQREAELGASDLAVAAKERRNTIVVMGGLMAVGTVGVAFGKPPEQINPTDLVVLGVATGLLPGVAMLPFRKRLFANRASRSVMMCFVLASVASLANRLLSWQTGTPVAQTIRADLLIISAVTAITAMNTEAGLAWTCVPFLGAAAASAAWPHLSTMFFPISAIVATAMALFVFQRRLLGGSK